MCSLVCCKDFGTPGSGESHLSLEKLDADAWRSAWDTALRQLSHIHVQQISELENQISALREQLTVEKALEKAERTVENNTTLNLDEFVRAGLQEDHAASGTTQIQTSGVEKKEESEEPYMGAIGTSMIYPHFRDSSLDPTDAYEVASMDAFQILPVQTLSGGLPMRDSVTTYSFGQTQTVYSRALDRVNSKAFGRTRSLPIFQISPRRSEMIIAVLMTCNTAYMGIQLQYEATHGRSASDAFRICSATFCILFVLDLLVRRCIQKDFFASRQHGKWNMFDCVVIFLMVVDEVMVNVLDDSVLDNVPPIVRSVRLVRLLRFVRVVRVMPFFRELRLMIFVIQDACKHVLWVVALCVFLTYLMALIVTQGAIPECASGHSSELCDRFGTIDKSMLTLYESMLMGRLWGNILQSLNEVDAIYAVIFVVFITFSQVIIMHIALAIVIDIQSKAASREANIALQDQIAGREQMMQVLAEVFQKVDINSSGGISREELELALEDDRMHAFLSNLQIEIFDAQEVFNILDADGSGALDVEEFVMGCLRTKGEAKAFDVYKLQVESQRMNSKCEEIYQFLVQGGEPKAEASKSEMSTQPSRGISVVSTSVDAPISRRRSPVCRQISSVTSNQLKPTTKTQIAKVEDRAMTLAELQDVRATVMSRCLKHRWTDAATGEVLVPEMVNLYHFNYHYICPKTAIGMRLGGLQSSEVKCKHKIQQIDPFGQPTVIAEGIVTDIFENGDIGVQYTKGQFVDLKGHQGECHVFMQDVDLGQLSHIHMESALSYKELVSSKPLTPTWFCSHWWGEPIFHFVACCERHAELRRDIQAGYWVCAYANRQHELGSEINVDLEKCSFSKALRAAQGLLLVLDPNAIAFRRIWCDYELYVNLCTDSKKLDIVTVPEEAMSKKGNIPQLLTDGLLPKESTYAKKQREMNFPIAILIAGIRVKLEEGNASVPADKERIMQSMSKEVEQTGLDYQTAMKTALQRANRALNGYFAQAAWPRALRMNAVRDFDHRHPGTLSLPDVLAKDECRRTLKLNFSQFDEVTDTELESLAEGLPPNLVSVSLCFEGCHNISYGGVASLMTRLSPHLQNLHLDFVACSNITDPAVEAVAKHLSPSLVDLRLDFAKCSLVTMAGVRYLAKSITPMKRLHTCVATFQGTQANRNFLSRADLLAFEQ